MIDIRIQDEGENRHLENAILDDSHKHSGKNAFYCGFLG